MTISNNLFSLMYRLIELYDNSKIIELFVEAMNDEFKPAGFYFIDKSENETGVEIKIRTPNSLFGYIRIEQATSLTDKNFILIRNAVKMLAVFLERAEFKENEERYRLLLENSLDAIMLTAPDGSVFSANNAACEMFQMTEQEICGLGRFGLVDLTDPNFPKLLEERNKTGKAKGELKFIRKDGSVFPTDISAAVYTNPKGEIRNSLIIRDISEQNRTRGELAHSYDLMKYVIEHSNGAVAVHDNELRYIYISERYLDDYKVKDYNIIGKHHYEVFPDLPQKWREIHSRVLKGEVCSSECDPYKRHDGALEWTRWECRPWFKVDETIGGIIIYTEVITNQVLAENALRESESRFRLLAETAPFGIAISDNNRDIIYINQHFIKIFGYTTTEIPSIDDWWPLAYPDKVMRDEVQREWDKLIVKAKNESEKTHTIEYPVKCKDGAIKLIEFRLSSSSELNFTIFIDITERKKAENELLQLKNDLEQQVQEKTKELQLRITELERFHDATIEREFRLKELRDEIILLKGVKP